jgi:hypothetical protein
MRAAVVNGEWWVSRRGCGVPRALELVLGAVAAVVLAVGSVGSAFADRRDEALPVALVVESAAALTTTYSTPGSYQFTVPTGVSSITFDVKGAGGGSGGRGANGGAGGRTQGTLAVTAGQVIDVVVGGGGGGGVYLSSGTASAAGGAAGSSATRPGGVGGDATAASSATHGGGGGGGGGSTIAIGATVYLIAGGGGGGGGHHSGATADNGGAGGGSNATAGDSAPGGTGGGAGADGTGGAAGSNALSPSPPSAGTSTTGGAGAANAGTPYGGGGGGGGGYGGGGGGGTACGGGGGDGFAHASVTSTTYTTGGGGSGGAAPGSANGIAGSAGSVSLTYDEAPTTPGAFTSPTTGSVFNGSHTVTHGVSTDVEGAAISYRIEASVDNGATWPYLLEAARSGVTGAIDFTSIPSTSSARLRVRAQAATGSSPSDWRVSDVFTIQHNSAPTAATLLSPVGGTSVDRTAVDLRWDFNDPDAGDYQSKADIRYRIVGAGSWTTVSNAATTNENYLIPSSLTAGDYEWQVFTYDATGTSGVWSASGFFTAANVPSPPTITSHAVDATIPTSNDSLVWSGAGSSTQARRVADDGAGNPNTAVVYEDSGIVTPGTLDWPFSFPVNNRTEHLQVRRMVSGLWSSYASVRVLVSYTPPATPSLEVTVYEVDGRDAALLVTITNPSEA